MQVYGAVHPPMLVSLRELLGVVGAYEWRRKGVPISSCDFRIHPHYGVFSPSRAEYLALLMQASLPENCHSAFDIGTGTGVLSVLLAKRGIARIIATDSSPRAVACARDNVNRLGLNDQVEVRQVEFFPEGRADLLVCNPPGYQARLLHRLMRPSMTPANRCSKAFAKSARTSGAGRTGLADHV